MKGNLLQTFSPSHPTQRQRRRLNANEYNNVKHIVKKSFLIKVGDEFPFKLYYKKRERHESK